MLCWANAGESKHTCIEVRFCYKVVRYDADFVMPEQRSRREKKMTTEENKRLMQQIFAELAKGNSQALVEALADDVAWTVTGTTKFSRTYSGKSVLINELVGPLFSQLTEPLAMVADRFIADGEYVVVECRGKATTKAGVPYNNKYCLVFRLDDGKIKELVEYMDTNLVVTTFGG